MKDVLKGMAAAGNSFKDLPPYIPPSTVLEKENKRFEGITVFFSLKEAKEGTKKIRVVKKVTWILFLFAGGFIPFLLGKWLAKFVPRME